MATERSIAVPFRFDFDGSVATSEGRGNIVRQEILSLMLTFMGERVMTPGYGSNMDEYLMGSNDERAVDLLVDELRELVTTNFPDVTLINLQATSDYYSDDSEMALQLDYQFNGTIDQLVVNTSAVLMMEP